MMPVGSCILIWRMKTWDGASFHLITICDFLFCTQHNLDNEIELREALMFDLLA